MYHDSFTFFVEILVSVLALCLMVAILGLKMRLDEQTALLKKILTAVKPEPDTLGITATNENPQLKKINITKEGEQ